MRSTNLYCLALLFSAATFSAAQPRMLPPPTSPCGDSALAEWGSQFRFSPCRTGFNSYEVILSPTTVGNLVLDWKYTTGGGISSPSVANGVVYVGGGDDIYALNAVTGALLWKYTTAGPVQSSPAVADGVVYVGSEDDNLYALNATTGALLWKYMTGGAVGSPAVVNGALYVTASYPDDSLYAFSASTGTLLWKYTTGGQVTSPPAVANDVVYFGSGDGNVYALHVATGALLWKAPAGYASGTAVAGGAVYVTTVQGDISALNASTGALLWTFQAPYDVDSLPAVANGLVYLSSFDQNVYALNANTGVVEWKYHREDSSTTLRRRWLTASCISVSTTTAYMPWMLLQERSCGSTLQAIMSNPRQLWLTEWCMWGPTMAICTPSICRGQ